MKKQVPDNPAQNRKQPFALTTIACLMVTLYLVSNIMAVRIINIGGVSLFDAGTITFPFAYVLGDTLTEVWGFKTARKVIFLTFVCNLMLVVFTGMGILLPYPEYQAETVKAYNLVFGYVPRVVIASLVSFLAGELTNAWAMEKIKAKTGEKHLWLRTIGSSAVGYIFDTVPFVLLAFGGISPAKDLLSMMGAQYLMKLGLEALTGTPFAYALIAWLKGREDHE